MVELLVVIAIIALLAAFLLPVLGRSKGSAQRVACSSNLRQLNLALSLYASDHSGLMPSRQPSRHWPEQLKGKFADLRILVCPAERRTPGKDLAGAWISADLASRSYLRNGFADYYLTELGANQFALYSKGTVHGMKESVIRHPANTILFGEKYSLSPEFDLNVFKNPGSYVDDLAEGRHGGSAAAPRAGSANYAMGDGSIQSLPWGKSTCPLNLWAVLDEWRTHSALCRPR